MDTLSRFYIPIGGFLATVAFGFWLSKLGKPYNVLLFNVHKLIALGVVIITAIRIYDVLKKAPAQALLIRLIMVTGLAVVALFISGAFLSIGNVRYEVVKIVHNIAPVFAAVAMGGTIFLLSWKFP